MYEKKWTKQRVVEAVDEIIRTHNLTHIPTTTWMKENGFADVNAAIARYCGRKEISSYTGYPIHTRFTTHEVKWTADMVCDAMCDAMIELDLKRLPKIKELRALEVLIVEHNGVEHKVSGQAILSAVARLYGSMKKFSEAKNYKRWNSK